MKSTLLICLTLALIFVPVSLLILSGVTHTQQNNVACRQKAADIYVKAWSNFCTQKKQTALCPLPTDAQKYFIDQANTIRSSCY